MCKIKFKLIKLHKKLVFQIEEQDMNWNSARCITLSNGIKIRSDNTYVTLYSDGQVLREIYLRYKNPRYERNIDNDNYVTTISYDNNELRDLEYNKIIESIKEWSENRYN